MAILATIDHAQDLQGAPPLLLLGNDQEWSSRSLESVLGPRGFATVRAFTGRQVLELSRTTRADAVVLDLSLPDVSGLDVVRMLREEPNFSSGTPIILLTTGTPTRAQRLEAYRAGAWELLSEPYDVEVLALKLELFVRAKREADRTLESGLLDPHTGLYNARGIARRAREIGGDAARRGASIVCVAFSAKLEGPVASDGEHDVEGLVLHRLSEICRQSARVSDVIGRLGRTEVVVIAPDTTREGAERIVARVRSAMEETPLEIGGHARALVVHYGMTIAEDFSASSTDVVSMVLRAAGELRDGRRAPDRGVLERAASV